ncbi:MAG: glycerophosphodiester phosphodiesterase family protein [Parcubacteria group bacterium]|jgi:glycerophosphoryl diester phosphodiesterase
MKTEQWIQQQPIAHRGAWGHDAPENSLGACQKAVDASYPIELDVQMSADGAMIVFHDWSLKRMCNVDTVLSDMTKKEISACILGSSQEHIPTLDDVLALVRGRVPLLIEMKNKRHDREFFLATLRDILKKYHGNYALSSFDPLLVKKAKKYFPQISCGQNFTDYKNKSFCGGWVRKIGLYILWSVSAHMPDFFVCRASLLPRCWIVSVAHKKNKPLLTWAIKDIAEYNAVKNAIDNEIFDHAPYSV